jgi:hypothetical protein
MKKVIWTFVFVLIGLGWLSAQVYTDFEANQNVVFEGWPNFPAQVINPSQTGINLSDSVGQWARGGEQFAHCYSNLASDIDFSTNKIFEMKVFSPIVCPILFKLEDSGGTAPVEVSQNVTTPNAWELLSFDFSFATTGVYDKIIIFFDFASFGTDTFYFDDLELVAPVGPVLSQIDVPVTFEDPTVNYTLTDFGGNTTVLGSDPGNANNTVAISAKDSTAQTWAGTTIGTAAGFANALPFASSATKMSVMVYSPDAGVPVRLKVEDAANAAISVETEDTIALANTWDTLVFDFSNEITGTQALNLANTYEKASIFFNFGTDGATAGSKTYYWDNVEFLPGDTTPVVVDSISDYCATYTTHFNIPAEVASAIILTITNVDATSMYVEIESADADPVDLLLVTGGSGANISDPDTSIQGKIKRTLTWIGAPPPTDVTLNVLWSKVSFVGNWMLSQADIIVPFIASCSGLTPPPPALSQMDLPVTFDDTTVNYSIIDFGGAASQFVTDPTGGTNQVVQTEKTTGAQTWAGTSLATTGPPEEGFANPIAFSGTQNKITVSVYSPAAGIPVMLKVEDETNGAIFAEAQDTTTVTNDWETLTFDYSMTTGGSFNLANTYDKASIFFDFGNAGSGNVFYWDNIELVTPTLAQIDLPVDFESTTVDYTLTDFGGNTTVLGADPVNATNTVAISTKDATAQTWAGTTVGTALGFANVIPFTANATSMQVLVFSPDAGIPVRLKVEDATNAAISVETEANTTMANSWETLVFDFSNEVVGTAPLNLANTYDKASIFFNFGTDGATAGIKTYYWDNVEFNNSVVPPVSNILNDFDDNENMTFEGWPNWPGKVANPLVAGSNTTDSCASWQRTGETYAHAAGFPTTPFDFTTYNTFSIQVLSAINCNVLFKIEDMTGANPPMELMDSVEVANEWFELTFNFSQAPSNVYNKLVIFFDFASNTDTLYHFDEVKLIQGPVILSQIDLPVDFEAANIDYTLTDFGDASTVLGTDPAGGTNNVAITTKGVGAQTWAGTTIGTNMGFASVIPFSANDTKMSVKVYSPATGIPVRLKIEDHTNNTITCETEVSTTVANTWETLEFDFANPVSGTAALDLNNTYDMASIFFDFGTAGAGDVYYWDDVMFVPFVYDQMDLPVTFDDANVAYGTIDFGGTTSIITTDPTGGTNQCVETTKGAGAATWAGTTLATSGPPEEGFINPVPFTATQTQMTVDIYAPATGVTVMLKLEDETNSGINVEAQAVTSVANAWETLTFDFSNPTGGAFDLANTYDKAILFYDFGNGGTGDVFYWDNVDFDNSVAPPISNILNDFDDNENMPFEGWPNWPGKVANPLVAGSNTTDSCASWQRTGETYAHAAGFPTTPFDFTTYNTFSIQVLSAINCNVLFKIEDMTGANPPMELMDSVEVANEWFELTFNFSQAPSNVYNKLVIFFDFASNTDTLYHFDEVKLIQGPVILSQIDLPVDFEAANIDYTLTDFGGATTVLGTDPVGGTNNVAITTKGVGAQTWAGTTIGTTAGFASAIPFTSTDTKMSVKVYSPAAGSTIRLKVEDHTNATISCETDAITTVANAWETIEFDFNNPVSGTAALDLNNTYNMASIFFDFGTAGAGDVFYWDDVMFAPFVWDPIDLPIDFESVTTDYTFEVWGGMASELATDPVDPNNTVGKSTKEIGGQTWAGTAPVGIANGLANAIPFDAAHTKMAMRVYSPASGIPVVFKVENKTNGAITCEVADTTTVANSWETLIFDFSSGTPALDLNNTYDKVALFFGFGNTGTGEVYFWDDIVFIDTPIVAPNYLIINDFDANENVPFEGWPNWPGKVANPDPTGINTTDTCAAWQRTGETWAHAAGYPGLPMDFSTYNTFEMKVWSPIACDVLFKLEDMTGGAFTEVMGTITTPNQWVELSYNFSTAQSNLYDKIVIFFDFASNNDTLFYFDEVILTEGPLVLSQIDLPVDFESTTVDYTLTDFGGATTILGTDPVDGTNNVAVTTKTAGAQTWAGTTIGTADGFANAIPFTAFDTKISVKVYSPAAGVSVLLKVEDHTNSGIFSEVFATTTVANAWETLEFDYASGNPTVNLANTYDMASIFFDFGNTGTGAMYFWDDVMFVPFVWDMIDLPIDFESTSTDYTFEEWGGTISEFTIDPMDSTNHVAKSTKTANAATWAGTAPIGVANGLANAIPFTSSLTKMKMRVYSPAAGIPILLKVEDKNDGTHSCETLGETTLANAWETIEFDLANEQPGTPVLNLSWSYNKVALFFGFGNTGTGEIYYWDDIEFIDQTVDTQTMNFVQGWSIFSTYIDPFEADLDSVFAPIISEVQIVKDGNGVVYWPAYNLNDIGDFTVGLGYQIKLTTTQNLDIIGEAVQPENEILNISQGWGIIGYLRQTPGDIATIFSSVVTNILLIKDGNGLVYWPAYNVNMIINMLPGLGYQIKAAASMQFAYPANAPASKSKVEMNSTTHFSPAQNTGNNHTLGIPAEAWQEIPAIGDEIAAYAENGMLVGSGTYQGGTFAMTLWGNDELSSEVDGLQPGEAFNLKHWNKESGHYSSINIESWKQGNGNYDVNGISVAKKVSFISSEFTVESYPNPATGRVNILLSISSDDFVEIAIYNSIGVKVDQLQYGTLRAGEYYFDVDLASYSMGTYFYRVQAGEQIQTKAFQVIK